MLIFNNYLSILYNNYIANVPLLSTLIWLPIIGGCLGLLFNNKYINYLIIIINLFNLILSFILIKNFQSNIFSLQFVEDYPLLPNFGISYSLGVDGLAVLLISLSCFIILLALMFDLTKLNRHNKITLKLSAISILAGLINGVLTATNSVVFYMFFESILIPLYFVIGIWGSSNRLYAATKFFLYGFLGSLLFLIGILCLHQIAIKAGIPSINSFDMQKFCSLKLSHSQQILLMLLFFIGFAIKIPMVPLHSWLPDAHYEAPCSCSAILAGIILKLAIFAMLRFLLPLQLEIIFIISKYIILLSLITIIYMNFIAFAQKDFKKLIAYSSIANMGVITIGIFLIFPLIKTNDNALAIISLTGALIQIFAHALTVAGLFFSCGILFNRFASYKIKEINGLADSMPIFAILFIIFCLANIAMPGTLNFIGELMIIVAGFKYSIITTTLIASILILSLFYTLLMYKNIVFEIEDKNLVMKSNLIHENNKYKLDLSYKELIILASIGCIIVFLGIKPNLIVNLLNNFSVNFIKNLSIH